MFIGIGTVVNVATILAGSILGVLIGHRLSHRTRDLVTDALGLVTLLIAIMSALTVQDEALSAAVGDSAPVLIVLGAMLIGGITGSMLRIEQRLEGFGAWLQHRFSRRSENGEEENRFVEGFVSASMVFCVGPLTILGALSDGLGRGADQLLLKAVLDGFASIAFAASLGWGVAASALVVLVIQGLMTGVGALLGDVLPDAHVAALGATGGLLLVGVALRLLKIKQIAVADLLPALVVAPLLVQLLFVIR
ncbi:DUF554 domain-containing protein [Kribbella deserti]|uniref:DUF554 domain-containing protein n=1 Tax=Kribbella deserti TaxID=1926257 RepID=A0ABV6QKN4_9ACTN